MVVPGSLERLTNEIGEQLQVWSKVSVSESNRSAPGDGR